jgi:hypothetical protein
MWFVTLKKIRPLSKVDLHPKSSCLKRPWNSSKHYHLLWKAEDDCFTTKSSKGPSVGYWKGKITSTLNPMVTSCVMNQSHDHWLLLDALITTIILTILTYNLKWLKCFRFQLGQKL